jgi:PRTRC genetic system protein C
MPLEANPIARIFNFQGRKLPDLPGQTPEQVRDHYAGMYPELATATITGPETTATGQVYSFERAVGSKG